jgi:hypothetical protein
MLKKKDATKQLVPRLHAGGDNTNIIKQPKAAVIPTNKPKKKKKN